jgi:hypothetical protein
MPGVEEHGYVATDATGKYGFTVSRNYDAIDIRVVGGPCSRTEPATAQIPTAQWKDGQRFSQDFMCVTGTGR